MSEYKELELIQVNDNGKIVYYAVCEKTADNMLIGESAYSYSNDPRLNQIKMKLLGRVLVEQCNL